MEIPTDTNFVASNLEHCISNPATHVVENETKIFLKEVEVAPSRAKPSEQDVLPKHKQGASETSQQLCSHTTLCNPYSGYYGEIFYYLMLKSFPSGASESLKRMLKRSSQYYCVIDGGLHYGRKNPKKVVSEKEEQKKVLARAHIEEGTGVHRGTRKMYELINSTMFWRFLYVDIANYIKECKKCIDYSNENHEWVEANHEPVKPDWPKSPHIWEKIYLQILGPYPKTASRNEFVVTILDPVSHWIVAQPIAFDSSLSSQVSCLIFKTFCDFGFTKCTISSVPPQISSDILNKLKKYEDCLRKVTAALGVPVGAAQICNIVKCQDKVAECAWLSELFSAWVQDNPCTWDKDLDEFLFEFRALPKNGAPSPFRSMFNRRPVRWSEADKENILQQNPVPELPKRRKLQGSLMKCRHCDELFTSKMSFRIHQRKHTEEARRRGMMEGEEPFRPVEDHESINNDGDDDDGHRACRSANQNASTPVADNAVNVWKRLKKITNKGSQAQIGKPQLREEVQKQLRATAVAAVKNIILTTKDARKKRGKYHKYPQNVQDEMARYAILHGILKTTHHFSDQLGVRVSNSTVRNIVKLHSSFTPQLKEEIGRFAAGFGVEAASRHFSERLDREVRQGLVRKFKKLYVARISDCSIKLENSGHPSIVSSKQKNIFDEKLKEEIGKYACEAGIASTVKFFLEKHTLRLKESLVRRLRKQYLDRNRSHANGSNVPEVCQHKQNAITEETQRPYQGNENVVHAFYTDQVYQSAPYIQTNGNLLPPQNSALHFNTMNNTTNSAGFLSYQQVPSSTTSVIVNQDSISVPIFQQPEQMYSSVTHQGHIIHGSVIPVPTSLASVPHSHFHFQPPVVTNTTDTVRDSETSLQPEHQFQQVVSSSANTTEVTVATVHVVPSLTQKLQPQADCNSSPCSLQPQAVVINESQHPSTVESSYPGAVVQTVGDKITMLSTVDTGGASLVTDRDGTYALTTCIPTGEKSLYKPQTFHLPISRLDTVAMAVCRDDSQTMNDVIITIVPSSENEKTSCKDDASFQDCQKISNTTFLFEKDQQHVYQKHLSKEQSHVIPVQLQQIEHFPEGQSHKPKLHQEQPEEQQQEKHHHLSGPQVLHLQLPLLQEQEDKTLFRCKQQQELPQKTAYQQQQTHHLQQPLLVQQNDSPTLQNDQHRQILLLQPHLPQEQSQKQLSQQNQQHLQQMQQQLLHQSVQLQEPQAESVQHLKKQHFYHPQQQLLLLQPHLNQNQLQKLAHQQNQLQILQLQQTKELMQQQKSKLYEHQKLIQMQQLFNCEQKHTVNQQKQQQLLQSQQPLFQLHLQFDLEQQKSAHEQAQQHSHHSQLYLAQEQTHEGSQQQHKLEHLDQLQQEVLQLQQNFTQEQPQDSVEQQKHQQLPQLKHQEIQLQQQLDHEQLYKSAHQEQPQVLHLYQQLVPKQTQKPTHQEKLQHLHQSEHQVRQLQEQLVQDQEPVDEETQHHSHQTEHRILELQEQLVQEQVQKPKHKEKQQHSHQSQHQVQQLPQQLNNEQPHQPVDEEKQQHFQQSQHQVFLLQQHLIQKQPQKPTDQEKQQHLLWPQHRVDKLQQHLVQKESQKLAPRKKCQNQHNSEHQALNLQQHLDEEQPRESVKQEKQQYLHLPQHQLLQVQQHLVEEQPQVPACQEKQQNVYQSEHQVLQSQHLLVQEQQQQQMHQEKPHLNQSHHEELLQKQLASENVQEPAHQEKQQHLHHSHHKAFYHQKHLSQEQVQELTHQEKIQQVQPHLQQPHQMLHLGHASHHDQLKKQANQQLQLSHPNLFNPQQQDDRSKTHNTHQQSLQPQKQQSIYLGKEQSLQGQKSYPSSHKKRQLEVLPHVKVTCSFEDEESTDEPDKMVIYVADASDITHETTAKEQKKNSSGNSRKENNRNKSKAGDSSSHKRGNYMLYSPELRAELGRYAAEYGNQRAREYFKDILGHEVPESTLRSLRDKYILKCHLNSNAPDGINSVTSLGYSPRGRPLRLGKYDDIVRECIQDLMQSGEKVSKFLAIATAKQVLTQYEPELLVENGGNVKLTGAWAKSFLRRIGVQHDC